MGDEVVTANNTWVAHLMHYSLAQLRKRQRIVYAQMHVAYELMQHPDTRAWGERASKELQEMADSLTEAAMTKCHYKD